MKKFLILGLIPLLLMVPGDIFADESNPEWLEGLTPKPEIPSWVKNTAGWWSEGKITDDEFLSAVSFLKNNNIIFPKNLVVHSDEVSEIDRSVIPVLDIEELENLIQDKEVQEKSLWHSTIKDALDHPEKSKINISEISGTFEDNSARVPITITIFTPSGERITGKDVASRGEYSYLLKPIENQIPGIYEIEIKTDEKIIESGYLFLEGTPEKIPEWIKNTAGWWASDEISDDDFVAGIQFLVNTNMIKPKTITKSQSSLSDFVDPKLLLESEKYSKMKFIKYESRQECRSAVIQSGGGSAEISKCNQLPSNYVESESATFDLNDPATQERLGRGAFKKFSGAFAGSSSSNDGYDYSNHDYSEYYGSNYGSNYGYSNSDVQRMLDRADYYANKWLNDIEPYAQAWVDGRMSYDEYERKGMAIFDYYSNQYVSEFNYP